MQKTYLTLFIAVLISGCNTNTTISTAEQLIEAHMEALGGYDNYKSIHTVTSITSYKEGSYEDIHRSDRRRPNLLRITTRYNEEDESFGYCEGFDGAAWEYSSKIPVRVVGEPSSALRNASRFEPPYIDYQCKGYTAKLIGRKIIKDFDVYHLELTSATGDVLTYYFDANTLLQSIDLSYGPLHGEGADIDILEVRSDYRRVGGILIPFKVEQISNGEVISTIIRDKVEVNGDFPDSWFSPPLSRDEQMFKSFREDMLGGAMSTLGDRFDEYRELSQTQFDKKLENQVNTFGYELISYKRYEDAIAVFKMGIVNFPESSNLHDSLGETFLTVGDTINSIKHYKRSVALDPTNSHGKEVLDQISF